MKYFFHRTLPHRLMFSPLVFIRAFAVLALCLGGTASAQDDHYKLVSPAFAAGATGDQHSFVPVSSADGRFIAFSSQATNLVSFPTSGSCCLPGYGLIWNVFIRDVQAGTTKLVSINRAGTDSGNGSSGASSISADGRFVVFASNSSDLVANDTNFNGTDIFLRDTQTDTTTLISVNRAGTGSGNSYSGGGSINAAGRFVVFSSTASDLVANDPNGNGSDLFIRDTQSGTTILLSDYVGGTGSSLDGTFSDVVMSPDGRFVAFVNTPQFSSTTNVYFRDVQSATTKLVSVNRAGTDGGDGSSFSPSISAEGRIVAFQSQASDLLAAAPAVKPATYIRDMTSEVTTQVSPPVLEFPSVLNGTGGPALSADGRYVIFSYFYSLFNPLAGPVTRGSMARFDRTTGMLSVLSDTGLCNTEPALCNVNTFRPAASADGRFVTFAQTSVGFGIKEAVSLGDFLSLTTTNVTTQGFISFNAFPSVIIYPVISADGRSVAFSTKNRLAQQDTNLFVDVYRFDHAPDPTGVNGVIKFGQSAFRADEGGGSVSIPVLRTAFGATGATTVQFAASDRSANAGSDYAATSGTLTFNPGEDVKFITVPVLNDNVREGTETFAIGLSNPTDGYVVGSTSSTTTVFIHDSIKPRFTINDVATSEGGDAVFTVTLSEAPLQFSAVRFSLADGTAKVQDGDYTTDSNSFSRDAVFFNPGQTTNTITVHTKRDFVNESDETFFVNLSPVMDDYVIERGQGTATIHDDRRPVVEFAIPFGANFADNESSGGALITVSRTAGDPSVSFSVNYATTDDTASERSDYTAALGRLDFAPGELSKTFTVLLNDDVFVEDREKVTLTLSSPTNGAVLGTSTETLFIDSNDPTPPTTNPLDDSRFFVTQHYKDSLNRLPDPSGLDFWANQLDTFLTNCDSLAGEQKRQCVLLARAQISTAFFLSIESQQTGYLVYRLYRESFNRAPTLREFLADTQEIGRDVVVGEDGWEQKFEANKQKFADAWVRRPDFRATFDGMSNTSYVSTLFLFGGGDSGAEPGLQQTLVGGLNAMPVTETRATVLRKVADSRTVFNRQYNPGLVLLQYFTYLRRNPDDAPDNNLDGYNFWLAKLDAFSVAGEDVRNAGTALARIKRAQMVEAFIDSTEYRRRLGP